MTLLRRAALLFNIAMLLWLIYETFVVSGYFGPAPSHFPLGPGFYLYLIAMLWLAGNALWGFIEMVNHLRRRLPRYRDSAGRPPPAPMVRTRHSLIGKAALWVFIAFNIVMLFRVVAGLVGYWFTVGAMSDMAAEHEHDAFVVGLSHLMGLWAICAVPLGLLVLLTSPKR